MIGEKIMKKNMKKTVTVILMAALLAVSSAACSSNSDDTSKNNPDNSTVSSNQVSENTSEESSTQTEISQISGMDQISIELVTEPEKTISDIVEEDKYFLWQAGAIVGLTDEGRQQKELVIPEPCPGFSITSLGDDGAVFKSSSNLESIIIENDDTRLQRGLFSYCTSLKKVKLPQNIDEIPETCFSHCESLESIEIPNGVTSIGGAAFEACTSLKSVKIPEGVTKIEEYAFQDCVSLEEVYIPESVTEIAPTAFSNMFYNMDENHRMTIYVKKGSYADTNFDNEFVSFGNVQGHTEDNISFDFIVKAYY